MYFRYNIVWIYTYVYYFFYIPCCSDNKSLVKPFAIFSIFLSFTWSLNFLNALDKLPLGFAVELEGVEEGGDVVFEEDEGSAVSTRNHGWFKIST